MSLHPIDDPTIFCEDVHYSIEELISTINNPRLMSRIQFHNELQRKIVELAHEFGLQGIAEFTAMSEDTSWGSLDIAWLLNSIPIAIFEVDSSFRIKSFWKLDKVASLHKFWIYYGKMDEGKRQKIKALNSQHFIDVIIFHKENNSMSSEHFITKPKKTANIEAKKVTPQLSDTLIKTYNLYLEKNSIEKIAQIRGLTKGTIVRHFCQLIGQGIKIEIDNWIPKEKQEHIVNMYELTGIQKAKPIRDVLGEDFSYDEIRLVLANKKNFSNNQDSNLAKDIHSHS
jgi:hypothetical protein